MDFSRLFPSTRALRSRPVLAPVVMDCLNDFPSFLFFICLGVHYSIINLFARFSPPRNLLFLIQFFFYVEKLALFHIASSPLALPGRSRRQQSVGKRATGFHQWHPNSISKSGKAQVLEWLLVLSPIGTHLLADMGRDIRRATHYSTIKPLSLSHFTGLLLSSGFLFPFFSQFFRSGQFHSNSSTE